MKIELLSEYAGHAVILVCKKEKDKRVFLLLDSNGAKNNSGDIKFTGILLSSYKDLLGLGNEDEDKLIYMEGKTQKGPTCEENACLFMEMVSECQKLHKDSSLEDINNILEIFTQPVFDDIRNSKAEKEILAKNKDLAKTMISYFQKDKGDNIFLSNILENCKEVERLIEEREKDRCSSPVPVARGGQINNQK